MLVAPATCGISAGRDVAVDAVVFAAPPLLALVAWLRRGVGAVVSGQGDRTEVNADAGGA